MRSMTRAARVAGGALLAGCVAACLAVSLGAQSRQAPLPPPPPPQPPPEGAPTTPALRRLVDGHMEPVRVETGFGSLGGIVWSRTGALIVSDVRHGQLLEWTVAGGIHVWREVSGGATGITIDRDGRLLAAERGLQRVTRIDGQNSVTILEQLDGKALGGPRAVLQMPDGSIYVGDSIGRSGRVIRIDPSGGARVVAEDLKTPSGLALSPSGQVLYVSDEAGNELRAYPVEGDGSLGPGRRLIAVTPWKAGIKGRAAGMTVDSAGHVLLAGPGGIWAIDANGGRLGVIATSETPAACVFGGADRRTLYVAAETSIYRIKMKIPGVGAPAAPPSHR